MLATINTKSVGLTASIGLHVAVLAALLVSFKTAEKPQVKVARTSLISIHTLSRTLAVVPTPAQRETKAIKPRIKPVEPKPAAGPLSSPLQIDDKLAQAVKPTVIDLTQDTQLVTIEPRLQLLTPLLLPDAVLDDSITRLTARIWLNEAGQPTSIEWLNSTIEPELLAQLNEYLNAALFTPFTEGGKTVAGVGILELQKGGLPGEPETSNRAPVTLDGSSVTPEQTAKR